VWIRQASSGSTNRHPHDYRLNLVFVNFHRPPDSLCGYADTLEPAIEDRRHYANDLWSDYRACRSRDFLHEPLLYEGTVFRAALLNTPHFRSDTWA